MLVGAVFNSFNHKLDGRTAVPCIVYRICSTPLSPQQLCEHRAMSQQVAEKPAYMRGAPDVGALRQARCMVLGFWPLISGRLACYESREGVQICISRCISKTSQVQRARVPRMDSFLS